VGLRPLLAEVSWQHRRQPAARRPGFGRPGHGAVPPAPRLLAGYTAGLALLTAAGLDPPLLALAAPLAGLCLGSTLATLFGAAAGAAPTGRGTETQAWINSIMNAARRRCALAGFASGQPILALALATAAAAGHGQRRVHLRPAAARRPEQVPESPAETRRTRTGPGSHPGSFG